MSDYRPFDQARWLGEPPWSGPELEAWEQAHGHDVRVKCYPEYGCQAIDYELAAVKDELDAARTAHRAAVRALSQALGERDRLADGIREHRDYEFPEGSFTPTERFSQAVRASERLWSLLNETTDDREDRQ